jgi:DnaJ domain
VASCACGRELTTSLTRCVRCGHLHTLGLDHRADTAEIKDAYRTLVKRWHPDNFHGDQQREAQANEKLARFNFAYNSVCQSPAYRRPPAAPRPAARRAPAQDAPAFDYSRFSQSNQFSVGTLLSISLTAFTLFYTLLHSIHPWGAAVPASRQPFATPSSFSVPRVLPSAESAKNLAGTFRGMTVNNIQHKGGTTLLLVQQEGENISGCFVVAPPMKGSGAFTGHIRGNHVYFNATSSNNPLTFVGTLSGDTMEGSIITRNGKFLEESGVFRYKRSPKVEEPVPDTCPNDQDRGVASGKLTMP